ncbi:MAG: class I SAM-dependent methyltransferase [Erysipelotrichaceae bacterium]|nr:class I SAM-dependent methyltransferase [Erysipelotrichaceae bacterium]
MLDRKGFDAWAEDYDDDINNAAQGDGYPFAGYRDIMETIYQTIMKKPGASVLELGFGTGMLASRLYDNGCLICGQDFSERMTGIAQRKMPEARLYQGDLTEGLVPQLRKRKYDFIVLTYCLHHLTDAQKTVLITDLLKWLSEDGQILIGDVAFENEEKLAECRERAQQKWDDEEYYFVAERMRKHFPELVFTAISSCGGILTLKKQ